MVRGAGVGAKDGGRSRITPSIFQAGRLDGWRCPALRWGADGLGNAHSRK